MEQRLIEVAGTQPGVKIFTIADTTITFWQTNI